MQKRKKDRTNIAIKFEEDFEVIVVAHNTVSSDSHKKHLMRGNSLLKGRQVFTAW
jgi:hypothetical protein